GGAGNDTVWSGVSPETLHGGAGAGDYLSFQNSTAAVTVDLGRQTVGGAGSYAVGDSIAGFEGAGGSETGDDLLRGGAGANSLRGEGGNDTLSGGAGDDSLRDLANEDWLGGGAGRDLVYGNQGHDTLYGDDNDDTLYGGQHFDTVDGGGGAEIAYGNKQTDTVRGGAGDDVVYGGQDNDQVFGGDGADSLFGNRGDDVLSGGAGGDVFFVHARGGDDRIADFTAGEDRIAVGGFTNKTPGQTPGLTADQWLATLTAQDTDAGLRLNDGDSFGLTLAGLTTANLSADSFLIL
ncbi:MAG: calcium-binding protein, partial [Pseudomonadota bacterium]|nr:calcium-binding protein [Pseudomonadota bacterium]